MTLTNLFFVVHYPSCFPTLDLGKKHLMDFEETDAVTKKLKSKLCMTYL